MKNQELCEGFEIERFVIKRERRDSKKWFECFSPKGLNELLTHMILLTFCLLTGSQSFEIGEGLQYIFDSFYKNSPLIHTFFTQRPFY